MSIEQSMAIKGAYTMIKVKLLKYERQVKLKSIFPIATVLNLSLKLEYIPTDEQEYILKNLKHLFQLVPTLPTPSTCTQSEASLNNSTICSKLIVGLINCKRKSNTNILLEIPISDEIFDYLYDSQVEGSHLDGMQWQYKVGFKKSTTCDTSEGASLNLYMELSIKVSFLTNTWDCIIQKGKVISKSYINFDDLKVFEL